MCLQLTVDVLKVYNFLEFFQELARRKFGDLALFFAAKTKPGSIYLNTVQTQPDVSVTK